MRLLAIPVKSLARAKGRLSAILTAAERAAVTLAMLEDVLDAALPLGGWDVWVVSPDQAVLNVAAARGARPVAEERPGLVASIRQVEQATGGGDAMAVVLGDLPLLTADALGRVLRTLGPVVAAPSASDGGTNVLLRRPGSVIAPRFGGDSLRKHRDAARSLGLPFAVVHGPELSFDLDRPGDVAQLLSWPAPSRTRAACLDMGLADRLSVRTP
ncbi:MAG: 2-phospho-L-lactate guanylyltransferase [Actinomycetota bacterium]|nr:2-phospho-L-lactate guanylyltransferase [Actinomycetota bacterium]